MTTESAARDIQYSLVGVIIGLLGLDGISIFTTDDTTCNVDGVIVCGAVAEHSHSDFFRADIATCNIQNRCTCCAVGNVVNGVASSSRTSVDNVTGIYGQGSIVCNSITEPILAIARRPCVFIADLIGDGSVLLVTAICDGKRSLVQNGLCTSGALNDTSDSLAVEV